ncbi:MAG TPA: aspartate-alanine antiporter [Acidobacteriota bacterium]|nr:aspartate-alanine antiporter [Acidobacteriota bacterium]HQM63507.1 aspartate-alanine antiporter [Acidobacteriota bacterium]
MEYFITALRENPELAIFLTLAIGFLIGRIRIGTFALGNVVGTLLAGVLIGQLDIRVEPIVKIVFFDLFLFATGYKVGPQFFRGLKKNALPQVALTVVLCVTSLVTAVTASKLLGYDCGTAAGLMAGAFTESTVIGTAGQTIEKLDLPQAEKDKLLNNIPVAYAVSYLVGTAFVVWFLSSLGPRLIRVNLKEESRKLEQQMTGSAKEEAGVRSAYREWDVRAYRVAGPPLAGRTVADIESSFASDRVFVQRLRRGGGLVEPNPDTVFQPGDIVAISARRHVFLETSVPLGEEVQDRELLDFPAAALDAVVTKKDAAEQTLKTLAERHGRGVGLLKLIRGGEEIPFTAETVVNRGDMLRLVGARQDVERAGQALGYIERPSSETDIVFVGLGILLGGFVGLLTIVVGDLPLSLTASGGALIMGLVFGWLRSVRPTFGRIPEAALWVFDTVGLAVFIGIVGLSAGPSFVSGVQQLGPSLIFVGLLVAVMPHLAAVLFGRYVLKMNPVILFGACSGAGTITAALRAIQDEAGSKLPVLGYTVPYAVGNILLTAWGPVIVLLMK